jgi:hypothetical protein
VSIEFPLQQKLTPFGRVSNPTIPVTVRTPTANRTYAFLLDTGADFSTVRCLFVDAPRAPFILGRADFLDRFVLTIDPAQRRIILTELP